MPECMRPVSKILVDESPKFKREKALYLDANTGSRA